MTLSPLALPPAVQRLHDYLRAHQIEPTFVAPGVPMPTVPLAAAAIGVSEAQILKSLLFTNPAGETVMVIASGPSRVDRQRLIAATGIERLRMADPDTVLRLTGFPAGGVAPVGHTTPLRVIIDTRVASLRVAYGGGGAEEYLLKITPGDIQRLTNAEIADVIRDEPALSF
jgi:prolyl-tRNA editing enzyme YbaK/EbsC (Cys-tRNA(Pro) deacylase)